MPCSLLWMDDSDPGGWKRLGRLIRVERSRRWPRRPDFAAAAGISERVLVDLELGLRTNFSEDTIGIIEAALGWEPGSAEAVRHGLRPRRWGDPLVTRLLVLWPRLSPDARRMIVELAERSVSDER